MQNALVDELKLEFPFNKVLAEFNRIDVYMESTAERTLFELKTDLSTKTVIRLAIGQLLEYGFHKNWPNDRALKLVIVGRTELSDSDREYLERIKNLFSLPLTYRTVKI